MRRSDERRCTPECYSFRVSIALDVRGLSKRFTVGFGSCLASAHVLRGVDLLVHAGECVAIVGPPSSGKSTLMLCLAGLLRTDGGEVRWFGDTNRSVATRRVVYHVSRTDLMRTGHLGERHMHLVDVRDSGDHLAQLERWIEARTSTGDAVVVATRDESIGIRVATSVLVLERGVLRARVPSRARVAERVLA